MTIKPQLLTLIFSACIVLSALPVQAGYWQGAQQVSADCDGVVQLPLGSVAATCVGLVASNDHPQSQKVGVAFKKPRKALELPGNRLLVTDMGGWNGGRGILWLLTFADDRYGNLLTAEKLLTGLNLPHDIKQGQDGFVYLGEADRISRFKLDGKRMYSHDNVITDLPYDAEGYRHPLTTFVFMANGDLLINVGSRSDNCGLQNPAALSQKNNAVVCDEDGKSALLRRYSYLADKNTWSPEFEIYADGLRNSMALAAHPSGTILQAENSSDIKSADEPYEELNIIQQGRFYGWPYCLNRKFDLTHGTRGCRHPRYIEPLTLIPPHTAPLDMMYFRHSAAKANKLPMLAGKLLMSWHGYRVVGNRLVAYEVDAQGLPLLTEKQVRFMRDPIAPATAFTEHVFAPQGDVKADRNAQHVEVIGKWNKVKGLRPEGAPVGLIPLQDGALLIVDDKNKALLRLSSGVAYQNKKAAIVGVQEKAEWADLKLMTGKAKKILIRRCSACHVELSSSPAGLLNKRDGWLRKEQGVTVFERRLTQDSAFMPPVGKLDAEELKTLLNALPQ